MILEVTISTCPICKSEAQLFTVVTQLEAGGTEVSHGHVGQVLTFGCRARYFREAEADFKDRRKA